MLLHVIMFQLEEEIERMSELQQGLRNKNDVLNICRLMVRAEDPEHRTQILKVLEVLYALIYPSTS